MRTARRLHQWSKAAIDFVTQASETQRSQPQPNDPVSAWFLPRIARVFKSEGIATLHDLVTLMGQRGAGWWKPLPRIGQGKAQVIVRWLQQYAHTLGVIAPRADFPKVLTSGLTLDLSQPRLVPLERLVIPPPWDGSRGLNRAARGALISARTDLEAIDCYLTKFRHQEKTERAYRKELERFLLWSLYQRAKPLSSTLMDDCEAYKDFLAQPDPAWIGPKTRRLSPDWKPFAGIPAPASQRYAIQTLRTFFEWLVNVRYLAGNPWITVSDPRVNQPITALQIDKALPAALWHKLTAEGGLLDQQAALSDAALRAHYRLRGAAAQISLPAQFRLLRAALLLLGQAGLRREEVAYATRDKLSPVPGEAALWELDVLGKRAKWRTVFLGSLQKTEKIVR
ncbi:MAG: hypothetical protein KBH08_00105 [Brachymonas sp.]|nr:hypothetical protein [Brachymonas sp.]